ncbi:uncharacterized protein [Nerophis lumbriciformis]|uniref:uncharacterized protein n=1 Tax=Nerophis lumbriciformis TaxID=546530 RepID=UPI002AE05862|nr:regulator of G-protein signaling 1-like [Nerophis lumbriciformis]XP_061822775.1 regulator of G-protein signaling 1-like [Nerophis lumbriciformis]
MLRKFSSEGSLLDIDSSSWRKLAPEMSDYNCRESGTCDVKDELEGMSAETPPMIQKPNSCTPVKKKLIKEQSVSVENLLELGQQKMSLLDVCSIDEGSRTYSDSQLASAAKRNSKSLDRDNLLPSSYSKQYSKSSHRHQHLAKLSAAKVYLKSLFGQIPLSSNSNLANIEQKDSAKERRSHLLFMHQWSQVGLSRKRKINQEELEKWAESLDSLLASPTGVAVFAAFLRTEFSEENLQFYLACEQYRHSSTSFSLQRRAKDICATYIQPGSPREVNLDCNTRHQTIERLQTPTLTSLSQAQRRIYSLLDTNGYPRFLQSTIYLTLLQEDV